MSEANKIEAFLDPLGDGNCGFRCISLAIFGDQDSWITVKQQMHQTYLKNIDTLYASLHLDPDHFNYMFNTTETPNWNGLAWFDTIVCPQIVADTYKTSVYLYSFSSGNQKSKNFFCPLQEIDRTADPILLYLTSSHFYLIKPFRTPTGKFKKITPPPINPYHRGILRKNPELCPTDYSQYY